MRVKILITGGTGQLGSELTRILHNGSADIGQIDSCFQDSQVIAADSKMLDITDERAVFSFLEKRFDCVINCAAATNVDACETNAVWAERVNVSGPRNLARACSNFGTAFVHISTDYVLAGDNPSPQNENAPTNPHSVYGKTKLQGEIAVMNECEHSFIVRSAWLYALRGKNFVRTIMGAAKSNSSLQVVDDQIGSPTNANDLAFEILKLVCAGEYGLYNCTGNGACSWYDFANEIILEAGIECAIIPCSTAEYNAVHPHAAPRPAFSILDNRHLRETVGDDMRDWKVAFSCFMDHLRAQGEI